jgi:hypothetical protein
MRGVAIAFLKVKILESHCTIKNVTMVSRTAQISLVLYDYSIK